MRAWIDQARELKKAIQRSERAVKSRLRVRESRGKANALADELLVEAAKSEAARVWLASDVAEHFRVKVGWDATNMARAALWQAAHAAVLHDGAERWPLTNAQHLVLSAGMLDLRAKTKSFGALHVGVLALVALGHAHAAIACALDVDAAQVRKTLRLAGAISLAELYAQ